MKERPIIFSAPMIQALIENRKTQTRRVIKQKPDVTHDGEPYWNIGGYRAWQYRRITNPLRMGSYNPLVCSYGEIGYRLWVRETFACVDDLTCNKSIIYKASSPMQFIKWTSPLFMPREYSRITLEITDVRVERLQEITNDDAEAEGVNNIDDYILLFESIYGEGSWEQNPFVWVIEFERVN